MIRRRNDKEKKSASMIKRSTESRSHARFPVVNKRTSATVPIGGFPWRSVSRNRGKRRRRRAHGTPAGDTRNARETRRSMHRLIVLLVPPRVFRRDLISAPGRHYLRASLLTQHGKPVRPASIARTVCSLFDGRRIKRITAAQEETVCSPSGRLPSGKSVAKSSRR